MTEAQYYSYQKQLTQWRRINNRPAVDDCLVEWKPQIEQVVKTKERCDHFIGFSKLPYTRKSISLQTFWRLHASHTVSPYASQAVSNETERLFREEAERWKTETMHWSSITKKIAHPSYLRIIGLAKEYHEVLRLLLRELQEEPAYWFPALTAITGANPDPVQPQHDFDEAVKAWLAWGRRKGILKD